MKIRIFILCCFLWFLPTFVFASYVPEVDRIVPRDSKVNVQIYIPSLLLGAFSGDVNFKLNDKVTIGPQWSYYSFGEHRGHQLGLTMNYALSDDVFADRVWLLNPYILYIHLDSNFDDTLDKKVKKSGINSGANLVYQWMWNSGVNMRAG
ncbi:MAG: hypothetical protein KKE11_03000, partial [Gammaproteobacteria bacterium]|nr:hypothetical protein [Gammaproteobacteria bacterium]